MSLRGRLEAEADSVFGSDCSAQGSSHRAPPIEGGGLGCDGQGGGSGSNELIDHRGRNSHPSGRCDFERPTGIDAGRRGWGRADNDRDARRSEDTGYGTGVGGTDAGLQGTGVTWLVGGARKSPLVGGHGAQSRCRVGNDPDSRVSGQEQGRLGGTPVVGEGPEQVCQIRASRRVVTGAAVEARGVRADVVALIGPGTSSLTTTSCKYIRGDSGCSTSPIITAVDGQPMRRGEVPRESRSRYIEGSQSTGEVIAVEVSIVDGPSV